jgi:phosphomannomutase
MRKFPASGEINLTLKNPMAAIAAIEDKYAVDALAVDHTDGLSVEYENWRFNLRMSNTEPVVRLNVESRADQELMKVKTEEILQLLGDV